ncbi:MAG TPA: hypothetical protein VH394_28950 [Thermoanaerobaculia bacterium]|jgi:hypothetical protein|nr:hypothetical protein [Thermoanaerobaculia bacterium]
MPKTGSPASAGKGPKPPRIVNVESIKATPPAGTLIHFSKEQWASAIRDIPQGKALPKYGSRLAYYPLPDGGGALQGDCIQNPCEICRFRQRFDPQTMQLVFECLCRPDPHCPEDPPPPPPPASNVCRLVVQVNPVRIFCASNGCNRTCRVSIVRDGQRFVITCACR